VNSTITAPPAGIKVVGNPSAGGAVMVEFTLDYPGNFVLVDHALARVDRGAWGVLHVDGEADPSIYNGQIQSGAGH
jgi:nitrite reductase (NO-forming)